MSFLNIAQTPALFSQAMPLLNIIPSYSQYSDVRDEGRRMTYIAKIGKAFKQKQGDVCWSFCAPYTYTETLWSLGLGIYGTLIHVKLVVVYRLLHSFYRKKKEVYSIHQHQIVTF